MRKKTLTTTLNIIYSATLIFLFATTHTIQNQLNTADKTAVFIIGTGRSGTSCTTGILQILGLYLGSNFSSPSQFNAKGSFEDKSIKNLNLFMYKELNMKKHKPRLIDWEKEPKLEMFKNKINNGLQKTFCLVPTFGIKHPHISFLLPPYLQATKELGYSPKLVVVLRHPEECLASYLERFPNEPKDQFCILLSKYLTSIMYYAQGYDTLIIQFNDLLYNTETTIEKLRNFIPGLKSYHEVKTQIAAFLNKDLKHHYARQARQAKKYAYLFRNSFDFE